MAIKTKTQPTANVAVLDADIISLNVIAGNAQIGGSQVKFKDEILIKGDVKDLSLGKGSDLRGETLEIITNVLDVNPGTNRIVITHEFRNGNPATFLFENSVDSDGDIFSLTTEYIFI